ncbi:hypothetical protein FRC03_012861 [Tulasnella sp. 419]|nr:hypothetical protein FRC03_012861 [Tulasnella sp. 419]
MAPQRIFGGSTLPLRWPKNSGYGELRVCAYSPASISNNIKSTTTMSRQTVQLALLICDTPVPAVLQKYGTYLEVFKVFLNNSLTHLGLADDVNFTLDGYDVTKEEFPPSELLEKGSGYQGILISGSSASAYADLPWIHTLTKWVGDVATSKPHIRFVGICFGHQIIARALGGDCIRNPVGWEVGTTEVELTEEGKKLFGGDKVLKIQQMHRDHVPNLPPSFKLLASSIDSPNQGMISEYSDQGDDLKGIHIFTVQGHPEFSPDIVHKIIDTRELSGVMDSETVKEGRRRADERDEGTGRIGKAIWKVLGVDA